MVEDRKDFMRIDLDKERQEELARVTNKLRKKARAIKRIIKKNCWEIKILSNNLTSLDIDNLKILNDEKIKEGLLICKAGGLNG